MAKIKQPKQQSVQNRSLYSRINYLYQAATYLNGTSKVDEEATTNLGADEEHVARSQAKGEKPAEGVVKQAVSRQLLTDMRATSLKTLIRLSPAIKQTVCKYCDTLMVQGQTCTSVIENKSKGGRKPWADILVITCKTCGGMRRFPVHSPRQKRRPARPQDIQHSQTGAVMIAQPATG